MCQERNDRQHSTKLSEFRTTFCSVHNNPMTSMTWWRYRAISHLSRGSSTDKSAAVARRRCGHVEHLLGENAKAGQGTRRFTTSVVAQGVAVAVASRSRLYHAVISMQLHRESPFPTAREKCPGSQGSRDRGERQIANLATVKNAKRGDNGREI